MSGAPSLSRGAALPRPPLMERRIPWLVVAGLAAAGLGVLAHENTTALTDLLLVVVAVTLFLRWPYLMLIVVLATGWDDNQAFELFTLVGGIVAVTASGRRAWRSPVAISFLALLLFALPRLPVSPTYVDGALPAHLWLPFTAIPYLDSVSSVLIEWWRLAFVLAGFLLASWLITDQRRLAWAIAITLATAAIPIGNGIEQYAASDFVTRTGTTTKSIEGPFSHPNYFGFYLLTVLILCLVTLLETRSWRLRLPLALLLIGGTFCLFATYTRSAWIGFAAAVLIVGLFRYRWILTFGSVAIVVAGFAFPSVVHDVNKRFADLSSNSVSNTNSYAWRKGEWSRMLPYGLHHPFAGTGFGSYQADTVQEFGLVSSTYVTLDDPKHPADSRKGFAAHNDYVRMLVELGFPGLVLWVTVLLSLLGTAIVVAVRMSDLRWLAVGVSAVIVALMVASYSDNVQSYTIDLLYPFVLAGGLAGIARSRRGARRG